MQAALRESIPWRDELRATVRGLGLILRSSPVYVAAVLVVTAFQGFVAPIVIAQTGVFLSAVPEALRAGIDSPSGATATRALVLIGAAVLAGQVVGPVQGTLEFGLQRRFHAYLSERLMSAVSSLPGMAYHEDPTFRDKLHVAEWVGWAPVRSLMFVRQVIQQVIQLAGMAFVAAGFAWWAPLLVAVATVPDGIAAWTETAKVGWARLVRSEDSRRADYYRKLAITLEPAKELRVFALGDWIRSRQDDHWLAGMRESWSERRRSLLRRFTFHAFAVAGLAVAFFPMLNAALAGTIDVGRFTAVAMALTGIVTSMLAVFGGASALRQANFYLPTALKLLDLPQEDVRLDVEGTVAARSLERTGIRFEGVSFRYPGTDRLILDRLDLEIPAGSSVALVGENGAGKTTLIKLLCRFYDPTDGRITLDGVDIREMEIAELRARLAVIFQDFVRYHLTARTNVGFGSVAHQDDPDLTAEAARRVGVLDRIEGFDDGWDTPLARDFGGVDLSGGEWQRIALARAIMAQLASDTDLLVLDEPTASLDVRIEHELYERFAEIVQGRTTILVSHRFSTVRMAERIVLIEDGRVTEDGSHDELVARAGRYAELYELQASHYRLTGRLD